MARLPGQGRAALSRDALPFPCTNTGRARCRHSRMRFTLSMRGRPPRSQPPKLHGMVPGGRSHGQQSLFSCFRRGRCSSGAVVRSESAERGLRRCAGDERHPTPVGAFWKPLRAMQLPTPSGYRSLRARFVRVGGCRVTLASTASPMATRMVSGAIGSDLRFLRHDVAHSCQLFCGHSSGLPHQWFASNTGQWQGLSAWHPT